VIRIVPTMGLAYLAELGSGRVIGFSLSQRDGYRGESFEEMGVIPGATFYFEAIPDGRLTSVSKHQWGPGRRALHRTWRSRFWIRGRSKAVAWTVRVFPPCFPRRCGSSAICPIWTDCGRAT
jgi:hypothetical protein